MISLFKKIRTALSKKSDPQPSAEAAGKSDGVPYTSTATYIASTSAPPGSVSV